MDSRITQAITFMRQNLGVRLTEKEFAQKAGLTAQHFCVLFKTETGETPARYLNKLRMDKARELLDEGDGSRLSVKEIAAVVGCNDLSHFVRDFEKRFGLSPKRYRAHRSHLAEPNLKLRWQILKFANDFVLDFKVPGVKKTAIY